MKLRRYYPRGSKQKYVISDAQFDDVVERCGPKVALERDNASFEIIPDDIDEAYELFNDCCNRVIENPKFYLENLDKIPTFKIRYRDLYLIFDRNDKKTKTL